MEKQGPTNLKRRHRVEQNLLSCEMILILKTLDRRTRR